MNLIFEKKDTGLYYDGRIVSPFIPVLRAIDAKKDAITGNISKTYHIYIVLEGGRQLPEHEFSGVENIPYFQVWSECCDAGLSQKQKRLLNLYNQMQAGECDINQINYYSRLGYFPSAYVFSQNMVISLESCGKTSETSRRLPSYEIRQRDWGEELKILGCIFKTKKNFSEVLFLYDILSITKPLFCRAGYSPNFFLAIFGKSGMGKTLLSKAMFVQHELQEMNFKMGNKNSVEKNMEQFAGHTVLIDDYHPEALRYDKERQEGILDLIARKSDDEDSGMAVVTAEFRGGCFSIQDRMFQMELKQGIDDFEAIRYIEKHKADYNVLLCHIAEKIYTSVDKTINLIRKMFALYSLNEPKESFRVIYASKILKICVNIIKEIVLEEDEWNEIKEVTGNAGLDKHLCALVDQYRDKQLGYMRRLLEFQGDIDWLKILYDLIYIDEIFVQCPDEKNVSDPRYGGLAVWSKEGRIYIRSATLKLGLEKYFGQKVSKEKLIKALEEEHILCTDKSPSSMKKVNGHYYYVINEGMLKEVCNLWNRDNFDDL